MVTPVVPPQERIPPVEPRERDTWAASADGSSIDDVA
jgi:hypothetical protein